MDETRRQTERSMTNDASSEPESIVNRDLSETTPQSDERIARRAYQRYEERGREDGRDLDDWLEAEREIRGASNQ
jgi:hypothetical protein